MSENFDQETAAMVARFQQQQRQQRERQQDALTAALGHPAGRAWLEAKLAAEYAREPYQPGDSFDAVAHRLGRIAVLREIAEQLHRAANPNGA